MKFPGIILSALLALLPFATPALEAARPRSATQILVERNDSDGPLASCVWGFFAVNLKGDTLVNLNGARRMIPASNLKLITTGAALLSLGENYSYKTTFATEGSVRDSVLLGNLYIIGGGDPLIGELFPYLPSPEETFGRWSKVLSDNAIRRIDGEIIGDGSWFKGPLRNGDWGLEDYETRDGVVPAGLTWRGKMGDSLPDSPSTAALHYRKWLEQQGVCGQADAPSEGMAHPFPVDSLTVLGTVESLPLRDLIRIANCQSDNFIAETLLKTLGKRSEGDDDFPASITALRKALAPIGLMALSGQMRFADGSGLARKNSVSPEFMVSFLRGMYRSRAGKTFLASLPFPGEPKTTLDKRLPKRPWALRHRIRMKSGSMAGVRCFSGYILSSDGKPENTIVFSLLTNNAASQGGKQIWPLIDEMIESLASEN